MILSWRQPQPNSTAAHPGLFEFIVTPASGPFQIIDHSLGLPRTIRWKDQLEWPHFDYYGKPVAGLA